MQLADVMRRADLTEKAVRLYESEGLIAPVRAANGRRVYSDEDLARLGRQVGEHMQKTRSGNRR